MMVLDMCQFLHRTFQLLNWEGIQRMKWVFFSEINVHKTKRVTNKHKPPCIISEGDGDTV